MTEQEETHYLELVHEVDVEARCVLHGKNYISMHPRIMNLGHGRAVINMGQAHCRGPGCNGTSQWITLELVTTDWTNVTEDQFKNAMRHALETEMGVSLAARPPVEEDEEEEEPVKASPTWGPWGPEGRPEPKKEVTVDRPAATLPFRRPSLGGVAGVPQSMPSSDDSPGDA